MKRKELWGILAIMLVFCVMAVGCDNDSDPNNGNQVPAVYKDFHNYPTGRVNNATGLLTIRNTVNSKALLFMNSAEGVNYIGTVDALGSVKVTLPDQKFYTIIAVDKTNFEEKAGQASQYSTLTYYSFTQPFTTSITPSNTSGNTNWVMNNNTSYWIQVNSADGNTTFAVLPPNALRVSIPINLGQSYRFIPIFSRELKYDGKVIALSETAVRSQGDICTTTSQYPTFTSNFLTSDIPSNNIKPTVLLRNNSGKTLEVFYSTARLTNGAIGGDFTVLSGDRQLISGFIAGDNTNLINFSAIAWETNKYVTQNETMAINMVYEVIIDADGNTTVTPRQGTDVYE